MLKNQFSSILINLSLKVFMYSKRCMKCDILLKDSKFVTVCGRGRVKVIKNSMPYFMNGLKCEAKSANMPGVILPRVP